MCFVGLYFYSLSIFFLSTLSLHISLSVSLHLSLYLILFLPVVYLVSLLFSLCYVIFRCLFNICLSICHSLFLPVSLLLSISKYYLFPFFSFFSMSRCLMLVNTEKYIKLLRSKLNMNKVKILAKVFCC